jgi:hypothetical protein
MLAFKRSFCLLAVPPLLEPVVTEYRANHHCAQRKDAELEVTHSPLPTLMGCVVVAAIITNASVVRSVSPLSQGFIHVKPQTALAAKAGIVPDVRAGCQPNHAQRQTPPLAPGC